MKLIKIKRKTEIKKMYTKKMGHLTTHITSIKKYAFGIPVKTVRQYRETYYGEIKECQDCNLWV